MNLGSGIHIYEYNGRSDFGVVLAAKSYSFLSAFWIIGREHSTLVLYWFGRMSALMKQKAFTKGQCHKILDFRFFHESVSRKPLSIKVHHWCH
jgi:hypothetical protein